MFFFLILSGMLQDDYQNISFVKEINFLHYPHYFFDIYSITHLLLGVFQLQRMIPQLEEL